MVKTHVEDYSDACPCEVRHLRKNSTWTAHKINSSGDSAQMQQVDPRPKWRALSRDLGFFIDGLRICLPSRPKRQNWRAKRAGHLSISKAGSTSRSTWKSIRKTQQASRRRTNYLYRLCGMTAASTQNRIALSRGGKSGLAGGSRSRLPRTTTMLLMLLMTRMRSMMITETRSTRTVKMNRQRVMGLMAS